MANLKDPRRPRRPRRQATPPRTFVFPAKYGELVTHKWLRDEYLLVAFATGYFVCIAPREPAPEGADFKEVFALQLFKTRIADVAVCQSMRRAAVANEGLVKMVDLAELREVSEDAVVLAGGAWCERLRWSEDGSILSVCAADGTVHSFLARMPVLHATCGTRIAYMSSLREVVVRDTAAEDRRPVSVHIRAEAGLLALGQTHVGVALNNSCHFYPLEGGGPPEEFEYMSTVGTVTMSAEWAAVLFEGRVQLHRVVGDPDGRHTRTFPDPEERDAVTAAHLTENFLIMGTAGGCVIYYALEDGGRPNEFRHGHGLRGLYPNPAGTRVVLMDDAGGCYLYNPVDLSMLEVPEFPKDTETVLWDRADGRVFVAAAAELTVTYSYTPAALRGPNVTRVAATPRPAGYSPMLLYDGRLTSQTASGGVVSAVLESHWALQPAPDRPVSDEEKLGQCLALGRMERAFAHASAAGTPGAWERLRRRALELLDVPLAVRVGRATADAAGVMALERLVLEEDRSLLAGHMAMHLGEYGLAQDLFLASSRPRAALRMQCDVMRWDQALRLAETLDPHSIPSICLQYAEQLQNQGEYESALARYEQAAAAQFLANGRTIIVELPPEHLAACAAGAARMQARLGNTARGVQLARSCSEAVRRECAQILEGMKQFADAAALYEAGGAPDRAVALYIRLRDAKAAAALLPRVGTPKLHVQYAQMREKAGAFKDAADAYEKGQDMDSVVRLCLEQLNAPQRACSIIRETRSADGAREIAKYSQGIGDYRTAIEFLLIAKEHDSAMEVAQAHDLMDAFALFLGRDGEPAQYVQVASYYESKAQLEQAADFYERAEQYNKALRLYLQVGEKALDKAIAVVGAARNEVLTHTLVDYLMGEHDHVPKDPNYIFRLYMALGNYRQAARTAVIIARQEQELGNYKAAHKMLFDTYKDLDSQNIPVPRELDDALTLLHSYVLVKSLVRRGDHEGGARLLVRVARSISRFPAHVVPILTSTVIECQRAGMKRTAYEYASMLMRPEYRNQIAEAYKRKIEAIVRKPSGAGRGAEEEETEPLSPCPHCGCRSPVTALECTQCLGRIPYCIVTGLRMAVHDWTICPSCRFSALYTKFLSVITAEKVENPEEMLRKAAKRYAASEAPE